MFSSLSAQVVTSFTDLAILLDFNSMLVEKDQTAFANLDKIIANEVIAYNLYFYWTWKLLFLSASAYTWYCNRCKFWRVVMNIHTWSPRVYLPFFNDATSFSVLSKASASFFAPSACKNTVTYNNGFAWPRKCWIYVRKCTLFCIILFYTASS